MQTLSQTVSLSCFMKKERRINYEREIKFRGKSKKTRKWLYGYLGESKFRILDYVYTDKVIFDNVLSFNTDNSAYVIKDLSVEEETILPVHRIERQERN